MVLSMIYWKDTSLIASALETIIKIKIRPYDIDGSVLNLNYEVFSNSWFKEARIV